MTTKTESQRRTKTKTRLLIASGLALLVGVCVAAVVAGAGSVAATIGQAEVPSSVDGTALDDGEGSYAQGVIRIALGSSVTISGEGASFDGYTLQITAAGVYKLSGTLDDGCIEVDAKGKVYLEFDGVRVTSSSGPALNVIDAKKVTLATVAGSVNSLTDADSGASDDAALFTNDTLVLDGSGTLEVVGNNNEGISSDDNIIVNSGTIRVVAVDDGLNAHDDITMNGGSVYILAGGDGLDSNGTVNINGGVLACSGGTAEGDRGIDAIGAVRIRSGTVVACGGENSLPDHDSTQCSIHVALDSVQAAGTAIRVERQGEVSLVLAPDAPYRDLLLSSGGLITHAGYQVIIGDTAGVLSVTADLAPEAVPAALMHATIQVDR